MGETQRFVRFDSVYLDPESVVAFHKKGLEQTVLYLDGGHVITVNIPGHEVREALEKVLS